MDTVKSHIRDCLQNYCFEDALFSAERFHAEKNDNESLYTLANCLYRIGRPKQAISLLTKRPLFYAKSQFLLAKCYYDLNYIEKAKAALQVESFSDRIVKRIEKKFEDQCCFVFFLLGEIFRCLDRNKLAVNFYKTALSHNPYLWISYERICKLGEKVDPLKIFSTDQTYDPSLVKEEIEDRNTENINPNQSQIKEPILTKDMFDSTDKMVTPSSVGCKKINMAPIAKHLGQKDLTFQSDFNETPLINNIKSITKSKRKSKKFSISESKDELDNESWMATSQFKGKQVTCSTPLNCIDKHSLSMSDVDSVKKINSNNNTKTKKAIGRVSTCSNLIFDKISKDDSVIELEILKESPEAKTIFKSQTYLDLLKLFGEIFQHLSNYNCEQALECITKLPAKHLTTGRVLYWTAVCFYHKSKYQYSKIYFEMIIEKEPWQLIGMDMYSTVLWHLKQKEALGDLAEKLLKLDLNASEPWIAAGNYHSFKKKTVLSIKFFQQALRNCPNDAYACTLLGYELLNKDSLEAAFSAFRHALRIDPRNYIVHFGMFKAHYHKDQLEQAEQHLVQAVLLFPKSSLLFTHLAILRERRGWYGFIAKRIDDRKIYTKRLCKLNEETDKALVTGDAITYKGSALHCFNLGVSLDPTNNLALYHRATLMLTRNYYQEAIEELMKLSKRLPNEAKIYMMLGNAYKQLHQYANAQINFARAVDLDPCSFNLSITASAYLDGVHTMSFVGNNGGNGSVSGNNDDPSQNPNLVQPNGPGLISSSSSAVVPTATATTTAASTANATSPTYNNELIADALLHLDSDFMSVTPNHQTTAGSATTPVRQATSTAATAPGSSQIDSNDSMITTRTPFRRTRSPVGNSNILPNVQASYLLRNPDQNNQGYSIIYSPPTRRRSTPEAPNDSSRMNDEILSQIDNVNTRVYSNNQAASANEEQDDDFSDGYNYSFYPDDTMDLDE